METINNEATSKKRQVKITFTEGSAIVTVNGSDEKYEALLSDIPDDIKEELLHYGWKQKVSDFRASDRLQGSDKMEAIMECHEMLVGGEFRQKGVERSKVSFEERLIAWKTLSAQDKDSVRFILGESLCAKLEKAS